MPIHVILDSHILGKGKVSTERDKGSSYCLHLERLRDVIECSVSNERDDIGTLLLDGHGQEETGREREMKRWWRRGSRRNSPSINDGSAFVVLLEF